MNNKYEFFIAGRARNKKKNQKPVKNEFVFLFSSKVCSRKP